MTQPFNLLSQKGYSTIGRQPHDTSFIGEICQWYETGDSDLPGSRNWLRQDASTSGQLPIEDSVSPNHCHTFNNCKCFRRQFEFQLWPIKCELNSLMSQFNEPASLGQNLSRIQSSILLRAGHAISLLTSKTCCSILRVGHVRLKQNWIINQSEQQEPTYWLN